MRILLACSGIAAFAASAALASAASDCNASLASSVALHKDSFRLPIKLGSDKLLDLIDIKIGMAISVTVSKSGGFRLTNYCDCFPPCPPPLLHLAGVSFFGTATAFGVTALWEDAGAACEPSVTGTVGVSLERSGGDGRIMDVGSRVSVAGFSFGSESTEMDFKATTLCRCVEACPEGRFFPHATALPAELNLIAGEPREFMLRATDGDGDLKANGVVCTEPAGGLLTVTPQTAGSPGGRTEAVFTVRCDAPNAPPSGLRFVVWDQDGRNAEVNVPVNVWSGRPEIVLVEEATGWRGADYVATFRIEDPDFAVGDGCRELVTWNVVEVAGGSVAFGDPNQGIERGCHSTVDSYVVVFTPDNAAGGEFTIEAVDKAGFSTRLTIPVNRPPVAVDDRIKDTSIARGTATVVTGNLLANDVDPDVMSNDGLIGPTWSRALEHGWLDVRSDGSFTYAPHNIAQPESFTYTVSDGSAVSDPATVSILVHSAPTGWSTEVTLSPQSAPGPPWVNKSAEIGATDADCAGNPSSYVFSSLSTPYGAALAAPSMDAGAPTISVVGLTGTIENRVADSADGAAIRKTVLVQLDGGFATWGEYLFEYEVTDPEGLRGKGRLLVHVVDPSVAEGDENSPPVAASGDAVLFDLLYNVLFPDIYALDPAWYETGCLRFTDPDGDALRFRLCQFPRIGLVSLLPTRGAATSLVSLDAGANYAVTLLYRVSRGEALAAHRGIAPYVDQFEVEARDPFGATATTTLTVHVDVLNNDPTCAADTATTSSNASVEVPVLANDADPEGDVLAVVAVGPAGHGTVALGEVALGAGRILAPVRAASSGAVTYTPARSFVGRDSFTYTVSDGYGGTATGQVTVDVTDAEPPVFAWAHPEPEPIENDLGICGAAVSWTPPTIGVDVTDNVGVTSIVASHAPGDVFSVGRTTVTYTATDLAANGATNAFDVVVEDRELPVLGNVPADILTAAAPGATSKVVTWNPITAADNCGVANVTAVPSSGTAFLIGATKVIVMALDVHGNLAERSFTVTVNGPLTITADDLEVHTEGDGEVATFGALTEGGCPPVVVVCDPASGSFFPPGATTVDVSATDACGVHVEGSFTVTVIEAVNEPPITRADYAQLEESEILISIPVLANDEDPDGDRLRIVNVGTAPCGETYINPATPDEVIFEAIGCGDYFGSQVWFTYTIEDEHGEQATAKVYVRIPDEGTLPRAPKGGG